MPATACSAKTSMASSMRSQYFTFEVCLAWGRVIGWVRGNIVTFGGIIAYDT